MSRIRTIVLTRKNKTKTNRSRGLHHVGIISSNRQRVDCRSCIPRKQLHLQKPGWGGVKNQKIKSVVLIFVLDQILNSKKVLFTVRSSARIHPMWIYITFVASSHHCWCDVTSEPPPYEVTPWCCCDHHKTPPNQAVISVWGVPCGDSRKGAWRLLQSLSLARGVKWDYLVQMCQISCSTLHCT